MKTCVLLTIAFAVAAKAAPAASDSNEVDPVQELVSIAVGLGLPACPDGGQMGVYCRVTGGQYVDFTCLDTHLHFWRGGLIKACGSNTWCDQGGTADGSPCIAGSPPTDLTTSIATDAATESTATSETNAGEADSDDASSNKDTEDTDAEATSVGTTKATTVESTKADPTTSTPEASTGTDATSSPSKLIDAIFSVAASSKADADSAKSDWNSNSGSKTTSTPSTTDEGELTTITWGPAHKLTTPVSDAQSIISAADSMARTAEPKTTDKPKPTDKPTDSEEEEKPSESDEDGEEGDDGDDSDEEPSSKKNTYTVPVGSAA